MIKNKEALLIKCISCTALAMMTLLLWHGSGQETALAVNLISEDPQTDADILKTDVSAADTESPDHLAVPPSSLEPIISEEIKVSIKNNEAFLTNQDKSYPRFEIIDGFLPNYLDVRVTEHLTDEAVETKPDWNTFEQNLNTQIKNFDGDWSLYFKELSTGRTISINDHAMESASLIKLYIMGAVYQAVEDKTLEKTDTIQDLLDEMITVSDNEASNELVRSLSPSKDHSEGMAVVNEFIRTSGFTNTLQVNGLADPSLWTVSGEVNKTSASDCGKLLEEIYNGTFVSHLASRNMESLLLNQQITYKIPDGLPDGTHIANKTGEVSDTENDSAIVYSDGGDYILCIMSTGLENTDNAVSHIHDLARQIYDYLN